LKKSWKRNSADGEDSHGWKLSVPKLDSWSMMKLENMQRYLASS
jgi:hypothetical protein